MNRVFLTNSLHQIKQKQGETMDSFHMRIKEKVTPVVVSLPLALKI